MLIPSLRLSREAGMGKPYSMDLRERVVAAIEGGVAAVAAIEKMLKVSCGCHEFVSFIKEKAF